MSHWPISIRLQRISTYLRLSPVIELKTRFKVSFWDEMSKNSSHSESSAAIGEAVARATAESVKLDANSSMSVKDLKKGLRAALSDSGVLSSIKSQLRREFIANMKQKANGAPSVYEQAASKMDLSSRITLSAVHHMLKQRGLQHSLAVFAAESGLEASKTALLSEIDIVRAMNIPKESPVFAAASALARSSGNNSNKENGGDMSSNNVLDLLMEHVFRKAGVEKSSRDCSIQTEAVASNPRQALDDALHDLREDFLQRSKTNREAPSKGIEEQMLAYQKECDERSRKDVELQMGIFRDHEVHRIRLEESGKARLALQSLKNDLENQYAQKYRVQESREAELLRSNADTDRRHQQQLYETRQKMQREVDEMRVREMATGRRFEIEQQGLSMLELQLKDVQVKLEAREREVFDREKDVDRRAADHVKIAKEEARDSLRAELEECVRDRKHLALERQRLEDERNKLSASLDSLKTTRKSLSDTQDQLVRKEQELEKTMHALKRAEGIIRGDYTDPGSQQNQLLVTMRRNLELESQMPGLIAENAKYNEAQAARERSEGVVEAQSREIVRLQAAHKDASDKAVAASEMVSDLKERLESERVKVIALTLKSKELERLLGDKRKVIASLAGGRNLPTGPGAGAGGSGRPGSASSYGNSAFASGRDVSRDGREKSYREMQSQFAYKRAEEFANALIQRKRSESLGAVWGGPAGGSSTQGAVAAVVNSLATAGSATLSANLPSSPKQRGNASASGYGYGVNPTSPSKIPRYQPQATNAPAQAPTATSDAAAAAAAAAEREKERRDYEEQMEAEAAAWEAEVAQRKLAANAAATTQRTQQHQADRESDIKAQAAAEAAERVRAAEAQVAAALARAQEEAREVSRRQQELAEDAAKLDAERRALAEERRQNDLLLQARTEESLARSQIMQQQVAARSAQLMASQEQQLAAMQDKIRADQEEAERKHQNRLEEIRREQEQGLAAAKAHAAAAAAAAFQDISRPSPGSISRAGLSASSGTTSASADISNISSLDHDHDQASVVNISNLNNQSDVTDNSAVTKLAMNQQPQASPSAINNTKAQPHAQVSTAAQEALNEELRKEAEDAARIQEARQRVLARRKGKQEREQLAAPAVTAASSGAGSGSVGRGFADTSETGVGSGQQNSKLSGASEPAAGAAHINFSRQDDSDVEITAGNTGSAENSDHDNSWF